MRTSDVREMMLCLMRESFTDAEIRIICLHWCSMDDQRPMRKSGTIWVSSLCHQHINREKFENFWKRFCRQPYSYLVRNSSPRAAGGCLLSMMQDEKILPESSVGLPRGQRHSALSVWEIRGELLSVLKRHCTDDVIRKIAEHWISLGTRINFSAALQFRPSLVEQETWEQLRSEIPKIRQYSVVLRSSPRAEGRSVLKMLAGSTESLFGRTAQRSVNMHLDEIKAVENMSAQKGMTFSAVIRQAIRLYHFQDQRRAMGHVMTWVDKDGKPCEEDRVVGCGDPG